MPPDTSEVSMNTEHLIGIRLLAIAVALLAWSCGGSNSGASAPNPSTPTPTAPAPAPVSATPLPLGVATGSGAIPCPAGAGPVANSNCVSLAVTCPSIPGASATLRITRLPASATNRGTVVLTTGGDGTNFQDSPLTQDMIA